jgi:uncharacterized DUF497 family protein
VAIRFSWDPRKAAINERKHGVSFDDATTAFDDPLSVTVPDPDHSHSEVRHVLLGHSSDGRLLVVAHRERDEEIRIISARPANRRERQIYEEEG